MRSCAGHSDRKPSSVAKAAPGRPSPPPPAAPRSLYYHQQSVGTVGSCSLPADPSCLGSLDYYHCNKVTRSRHRRPSVHPSVRRPLFHLFSSTPCRGVVGSLPRTVLLTPVPTSPYRLPLVPEPVAWEARGDPLETSSAPGDTERSGDAKVERLRRNVAELLK
ncbi:TOX high mobility group box family member 2-like isoform X1 [Arapaima gigas]